MKINELPIVANKKPTRVGRGIAAGKGKTAGRGTKGQGARKSGGTRPGFAGGQTPMYLNIPKLPGFRSTRVAPENIYTGQLDAVGTVIDNKTLFAAGLVSSQHIRVKLIQKGTITKKLVVSLQGASASAVEDIKAAGGSFTKIDRIKREPKADK